MLKFVKYDKVSWSPDYKNEYNNRIFYGLKLPHVNTFVYRYDFRYYPGKYIHPDFLENFKNIGIEICSV